MLDAQGKPLSDLGRDKMDHKITVLLQNQMVMNMNQNLILENIKLMMMKMDLEFVKPERRVDDGAEKEA